MAQVKPCSLPGRLQRQHLHSPPFRIPRPAVKRPLLPRTRAAAVEELQGADLDSWKACQAQVQGLGISEEDAEKYLTKAFAWKKGYWGPEKKQPEVPTTEQIQAVLDYLDELGIKGSDVTATVSKFPEVLGMKVEERMKANVDKIQNEFKIKGPALANIFKRKPQVLGFNWDCYGDCQGNCPRCWVHF